MSKLNKKAFTLIELIVVITVLGVLVLLATPRLLGYTEEAQLVRIQNDVKVMEDKMAETLAQSSESYDSWDNNSKDLGTLILRSQLFDKEGLASSVNVEHLMSKGSNLASLNSEANLASGHGIGGELYSIGISSTDENLESDESDLSLDPSAGYKIVPESFKNEINTKLDGTFYVNKFGKVYYEHEKPISSAKQEQVLACVPAESLDYEFDGSTGTITKYNGSLQHIIIPGAFEIDGECVPVKSIGAGAFMNGGFKEITIPQSVKEIEENAFKGNELEEIEIPHSVDYIGQDAFSNNRIESVVINKGSDNITIGTGAFSNNGPTGTSTVSPTYRLPTPSDLKVVFNKSSGTIVSGYGGSSGGSYGSSSSGGSSSSSGGSSINSSKQYDNSNRFISIPEEVVVDGEVHEVKEVAKGAFQGQGIIHVEFPNSLERIEDYAFAGNQLVGVQIPESIGHIGNYAFAFNEINEERTINYVNILDERNYEPQIDKLGNIAENGRKIDVLSNQVSLLDFIFVTSKSSHEVPEDYNPIGGENNAEKPIELPPTDESKFTWIKASEGTADYKWGQSGFGEKGYFKYIGTDEETVVIPHTIQGVKVTTYYNMFKESGPEIKKVISTNKDVTSMVYMFRLAKATSLDLTELDTSNVTNMYQMLSGTYATSIDISNFDTSNVTIMGAMFYHARATELNFNNFDTSNVTNMSQMLMGSWAKELDLSSFDTSNVINMGQMFQYSKASSIDLSSFDTSNVTNMIQMFFESSVEKLDLTHFDTSNVTLMASMFWKTKVPELDLSSFNMSKVTQMQSMFNQTSARVGYARTQADANIFNNSTNKPSALKFTVKSNPANFTSATFTNAGSTGYTGPTQSQLVNTYQNTQLNGYVSSQSGIQLWDVPKSGTYRIEARGAQGGAGRTSGGRGAIMIGDFDLKANETIKIAVGQMGQRGRIGTYKGKPAGELQGGGGGGTFVVRADDTPLIVSGGGGGRGGSSNYEYKDIDATITNKGEDYASTGTTYTSGGGGFFHNGGSSRSTQYMPNEGGKSFLNGANGSKGIKDKDVVGGFGGGGSGWVGCSGGCGAGGGGGYSGGRVVANNGEGGGSYNSGVNQTNSVGNTGHGRVTVTYIGE